MELITAKQAGKILKVCENRARIILEFPDKRAPRPGRGGWLNYYDIDRVREVAQCREDSGKKAQGPRQKYKKGYDFALDSCGKVVPRERVFRGRTCRSKGCNNPVETGALYCDHCKAEYGRLLQQNEHVDPFIAYGGMVGWSF